MEFQEYSLVVSMTVFLYVILISCNTIRKILLFHFFLSLKNTTGNFSPCDTFLSFTMIIEWYFHWCLCHQLIISKLYAILYTQG